jgi:hypothetical protein
MSLRATTSLLLVLLPLAALWWCAVVWWGDLPDRIPLHFGADGAPTRWGPPSAGNWFMPPIVATLTIGMVGGISLLIGPIARHHPNLVNMPFVKARWLALAPDARVRTIEPMRTMLAVVAAAMGGLFLWILAGTRRVAIEAAAGAIPVSASLDGVPVVLLFVGGTLALSVWSIVRVHQRVAAETAGDEPRFGVE